MTHVSQVEHYGNSNTQIFASLPKVMKQTWNIEEDIYKQIYPDNKVCSKKDRTVYGKGENPHLTSIHV